jgi:hypothetical protein
VNNLARQRLADAWRECSRHAHHMRHALQTLDGLIPLLGDRLRELDDDNIQALDQFVLRFGKLQDAAGARLLPGVLEALQEPFEDRPMIDKLNRLEKLGYIDSAMQWQELRAIRNRFAHDYPDDPDKNAALLNLAIDASGDLLTLLQRLGNRLDLPPLEQ